MQLEDVVNFDYRPFSAAVPADVFQFSFSRYRQLAKQFWALVTGTRFKISQLYQTLSIL